MDYFVGTGGWAYFDAGKPPLKTYSRIFNFVEVNYTFYRNPPLPMVEGWRRQVPSGFTFSVRCHRDLTHKIGLKPVNQAYEAYYQTKAYCNALQTPYMVLETPPSYEVNASNSGEERDFFSSLNLKGVKLVWEYRAPLTSAVTDLMQDFGVIHSVDLSREKPAFNLDVTYSRLFGKGQQNIYQFTDEELIEIDERAQATKSKVVMMAFHGLRMNTDALRFGQFKKTGNFVPATAYTGVDSARAVLAEDAKFPATKNQLCLEQGWKVIDLTENRRVHLSEVLSKIPSKTYSNLDEVTEQLKAVI